jgi:ATP-dependent RNA helicase DeaD
MHMRFEDLGITSGLSHDLESHGIKEPTFVQRKTIPLILKGKDVLVQSETGSGKTVGFAVPTIMKVEPKKGVQVLVVTPTRELAVQVAREYVKFSKQKKLNVAVVYGGVSMEPQIKKVVFSEIVVGTPGRLLDLLGRNALNISRTSFLVLDEAERLMDMGFIDDIRRIISFMPRKRQTMLFSATINARVLNLARKFLYEPEKVILENVIDPKLLRQCYYNIDEKDKISLLVHLLREKKWGLALIFCNTKRKTRFVSSILNKSGIDSECLNGDMTQYMREKALSDFSNGKKQVLVATDVAARGIHVEDIDVVINYDLHDELETYTHRIGRTARQGKKGTAITFLSDNDYRKMDKVMEEYGDFIQKKDVPNFERIKLFPRGQGNRQRNFGNRRRGNFRGHR